MQSRTADRKRWGDGVNYFEETDACWLGLNRLGALGRMTFSLLGAGDASVTPHPIEVTLAQEIGTLTDLHDGTLLTDQLNGADVILATQTALANLPVNPAEPVQAQPAGVCLFEVLHTVTP